MRLSRYFLPILKENPKEAEIISHRLMLRAGLIKQQASGIYAWLPLGKKLLDNISAIIREEQERAGAIEILMPITQSANLWRESGRYDDYGLEMLRMKDRHERDLLFGPTNEETVTDICRNYVRSYKDLPLLLYHIQWKFRDEIRPRFGVMRAREFLMKDSYSFDSDIHGAKHAYNKMFIAYLRSFKRLGVKALPMRADTGPIGGDLSHEFIILAQTGESKVFCDNSYLAMDKLIDDIDFDDKEQLANLVKEWTAPYAATEELHDEAIWQNLPPVRRLETRGIEVGHIFYFGTKYSEPMQAYFTDKNGQSAPVVMGSYGIGLTRLIAAIIEVSHDERGIIWPQQIAPFMVGLINVKRGEENCDKLSEAIYEKLNNMAISTLFDDVSASAGVKFARMDLIGLPWQIIIGPKQVETSLIEIKNRQNGERQYLSQTELLNFCAHNLQR